MNEKRRQNKIARNKKKRKDHKKSYDANQKCLYGSIRTKQIMYRENEHFLKLKKELGL